MGRGGFACQRHRGWAVDLRLGRHDHVRRGHPGYRPRGIGHWLSERSAIGYGRLASPVVGLISAEIAIRPPVLIPVVTAFLSLHRSDLSVAVFARPRFEMGDTSECRCVDDCGAGYRPHLDGRWSLPLHEEGRGSRHKTSLLSSFREAMKRECLRSA